MDRAAGRAEGCTTFFKLHLPQLRSLRHLAFHGLKEIGEHHLQRLCIVARTLPQLVSLHLVRLSILTQGNCLQSLIAHMGHPQLSNAYPRRMSCLTVEQAALTLTTHS